MNLVSFYDDAATDNRGRKLNDIQSWSHDKLETVHDYIQWLFPLDEGSAFNASAPILDKATIAEFRARPDLQKNVRRSFMRMLRFYGFTDGAAIAPAANFDQCARNWLNPGNHNHLRITRILKSLRLLGLEQEAAAFFAALAKVRETRRDAITEATFGYWMRANKGSSIMEVHSN